MTDSNYLINIVILSEAESERNAAEELRGRAFNPVAVIPRAAQRSRGIPWRTLPATPTGSLDPFDFAQGKTFARDDVLAFHL